MALVPGILALLAYYKGLGSTTASVATLAELCFPVTAVLLNWIALGTSLYPPQLFGTTLLVAALMLPAASKSEPGR